MSDNQSHDKEDLYTLWTLLLRGTRLATKAREKELKPYGISSHAEAGILRAIYTKQGQITPIDIARETRREIHTVNALLHRMQGRGMLELTRGKNSKNIREIHLTDNGYVAYQDTLKLDSVSRILSSLSNEERIALSSIMRKIGNSALDVIRDYDHPHFP